MIWTVIQISLRRLMHSRVELLLTFVVPIAFFSVFALIFGKGIGSGSTPKVKVVLVDEAGTDASRTIVDSLRQNSSLRMMQDTDSANRLDSESASDMVRRGGATIGIVVKSGDNQELKVDLLADASDQVAGQVVSALVARELVMNRVKTTANERQTEAAQNAFANVLEQLDQGDETQTPSGSTGLDELHAQETAAPSADPVQSADGTSSESDRAIVRRPTVDDLETPARRQDFDLQAELDAVQIVDVMGEGKANPVVSMYAAGIAVMFLLFGATSGGGVLLEERENTTLDRLLSTQMTMDQLLLGKWFYLTALGFVQVCVMFLWGQFVFQVDLFGHLDGFFMMSLVTSSAAAAFGLFLATLCKSRGQLNGLSVILILTMSALGGSMVPRYVMSERMRELGLWTFNAWALDGYNKVFWRDLPVAALWPQLGVLMAAGIGFLLVARALAVRWEFD